MRRLKDFKRIREQQSPEGDHNSNWAISYGDMITLLLAFFVLFFHVGSDSFHVKMIEKAINEAFSPPQEKAPDMTWGQQDSRDPASVFTHTDKSHEIKTTAMGDKLIVEFPNISFFGTAKYELTEEGKVVLEKFARTFQNKIKDMRLIVRGYTDNRPVKSPGHFKDNLELSVFRALSAVRVLNGQGIPLHLMRTGGYGETDKAQEITAEDQLKFDRKIVLVLEPLDQTERGFATVTTPEEGKETKDETP